MATKQPLSTIAYDEVVLAKVLIQQLNIGVVSFFAYIRHYGEGEGLSENKEHIHVYVDFNKQVDPLEFKYLFSNEFGNNTTLNWRRSVFSDWYPYVLHDEDYLASKGLTRIWHYSKDAMVASDDLELDRMIVENPMPNMSRIRSAILNGVSEKEMFLQGLLTPQNVNGVSALSSIINPKRKDDEPVLSWARKGGSNGRK